MIQLIRERGSLRIVVHANSKIGCQTIASRLTESGEEVVNVDVINPVAAPARHAFLRLASASLDEKVIFNELLEEIGVELVAQRARATNEKPSLPEERSPFKTTSPWPEPVDGSQLADDLGTLIRS